MSASRGLNLSDHIGNRASLYSQSAPRSELTSIYKLALKNVEKVCFVNSKEVSIKENRDELLEGLKYLTNVTQLHPELIPYIDQIIRNKDIKENNAVYFQVSRILSATNDIEVIKHVLSLVNNIIFSSEVKNKRKEEIWSAVGHLIKIEGLVKTNDMNLSMIFFTHMKLYIDQLKHDSNQCIDQKNDYHAFLLEQLFNNIMSNDAYKQYILWSNLSLTGLRFAVFFSTLHQDLFNRLLCENILNSSRHYFIPLVIENISTLVVSCLERVLWRYKNRTNPSHICLDDIPAAQDLYQILTSDSYAYYSLCCTAIALFDTLWKESYNNDKNVHLTLSKTREYMIGALGILDVKKMNELLLLDKMLIPKVYNMEQLNQIVLVYSLDRSNPNMNYGEMVIDLVKNVNFEELDYLSDLVDCLNSTVVTPKFDFSLVSSKFIRFLLEQLIAQDSNWMRHSKLSSLCVRLIENILIHDEEGENKFTTALSDISKDHTYIYKPLVKMIRNNWTFRASINIVNMLFESKKTLRDKRMFVKDLATSEALTIIKSKLWSSVSGTEELLKLQNYILSHDSMPFDFRNPEHEMLLNECWYTAFNIKLNQIGPEQWHLMGFHNYKSLGDFSRLSTKCLKHLLYFASQNTDMYRALILYNGKNAFNVGEYGIWVSNLFYKCTENQIIIPLIFDEKENTLHEMYSMLWYWSIQTWISCNLEMSSEEVYDVLEEHILSSLSKMKPSSIDDLIKMIGVRKDLPTLFQYEAMIIQKPVSLSMPKRSERKLLQFLGEESSVLIQHDEDESNDFVDLYLRNYQDLLEPQETSKISKHRTAISSQVEKPFLKNDYAELARSQMKAEIALPSYTSSKKLDSLTGTAIENMMSEMFQKEKDIVKKRKSEIKEQKHLRALFSKHKTQHKKLFDP